MVRGLPLSTASSALPSNNASTLTSCAAAGQDRSATTIAVTFAALDRMRTPLAMKPVAIFRHSPTEGPGYFATYLDARDIPWRLIAVDQGDAIPRSEERRVGKE